MHDIAFLFDLDGVVIDTERVYTCIWNKINDTFPTGVDNFSVRIKGTNLNSILSNYYPDADVRSKVEKMLYDEEKRMVYSYTHGAEDFLENLRRLGIRTALVTSSNDVKMHNLYRSLPELPDYFNIIINGDMVTESKPSPEGYLLAAHKLGIKPSRCIVFEDSLQGVIAGRRAGAAVCGVRGTVEENALLPYCDYIVDNLGQADMDEIINRLSE